MSRPAATPSRTTPPPALGPLVVLAGGPSSEHDVSLATSAEILRLLREAGHRARPLLVDRGGGWIAGGPDEALDALPGRPGLDAEEALAALRESGETAYVGLHGPWGEDGTVQGLLEGAGVLYTGPGPVASAVGMDKELSKLAATKVGARCPKHEVLAGKRLPTWGIGKGMGYPCFVKPVGAGSSVGVSRVEGEEALPLAVARAQAADPGGRCMVEALVPGHEVTCAVLRRGGDIVVLPLVEILPDAAFYDYEAKYHSERTRYRCPADVSGQTAASIEEVSRRLYGSLELRGVARMDFIVSDDGRDSFLELNTLPGFTTHSLVPMAARAAGWHPVEVLEAAVADAWKPT
jgi:D-alanine-D-alanine ligase